MFVEKISSLALLWGYRPNSHMSYLVSISESKHSVHSCLRASENLSQYQATQLTFRSVRLKSKSVLV